MSETERNYRQQMKDQLDQQESIEDLNELILDFANSALIRLEDINLYKLFKNELSDLENQLDELGIWSFKKAFLKTVETVNEIARKLSIDGLDQKLTSFCKELATNVNRIKSDLVEKLLPSEEEVKILEYSSAKVRALVDFLEENSKENKRLHGIVFVERKSIAARLNDILSSIGNAGRLTCIKSDFIHGDQKLGISQANMNAIKQV